MNAWILDTKLNSLPLRCERNGIHGHCGVPSSRVSMLLDEPEKVEPYSKLLVWNWEFDWHSSTTNMGISSELENSWNFHLSCHSHKNKSKLFTYPTAGGIHHGEWNFLVLLYNNGGNKVGSYRFTEILKHRQFTHRWPCSPIIIGSVEILATKGFLETWYADWHL